ncbi:MAG: hypothetical protein V1930_08225, partial [Pseudomonadota bacterium]
MTYEIYDTTCLSLKLLLRRPEPLCRVDQRLAEVENNCPDPVVFPRRSQLLIPKTGVCTPRAVFLPVQGLDPPNLRRDLP